jgi:hypothetical protein
MNSKLGIHIDTRTHGWDKFIVETRPAIVKSLDLKVVDDWPDKVIGKIREDLGGAEPNIFLLGRLFLLQGEQRLDDPPENARLFFEKLMSRLTEEELKLFDAIEGYNEISHNSAKELGDLAAFEAELASLLKQVGVAYAAGGFSTGHPSSAHMPDWEDTWVDAYSRALEVADYFHIHEYSWPTMQTELGEHCLRYRTLHRHMKEKGLARPIIISECGLDMPKADDGWQKLRLEDVPEDVREELREKHDDDADIIDAFYLDQLKWYDEQLQQDDYVVGATIYTFGGSDRWKTFDIDRRPSFRESLAKYLAGQNTQPHRKWEPGGAGPEPVEPGVEYKPQPFDFHFVLLAQDEDGIVPWSWIEALKNYIRRFRVSVGFSLDHAAMETPFTQSRHVTLIGSVDAPVAVSQEVEDILRAAGCDIDRVPGTSAKEIKEEMDRRANAGLRFG